MATRRVELECAMVEMLCADDFSITHATWKAEKLNEGNEWTLMENMVCALDKENDTYVYITFGEFLESKHKYSFTCLLPYP